MINEMGVFNNILDKGTHFILTLRQRAGCCCCQVASVVSDSVPPHRWQPTRLPHPWDSPGKNTGVGKFILIESFRIFKEQITISSFSKCYIFFSIIIMYDFQQISKVKWLVYSCMYNQAQSRPEVNHS